MFDKACVYVSGYESKTLIYSVMADTKTAMGVLQIPFNYFTAYFFKVRAIHISLEAKEICLCEVFILSLLSCICG